MFVDQTAAVTNKKNIEASVCFFFFFKHFVQQKAGELPLRLW